MQKLSNFFLAIALPPRSRSRPQTRHAAEKRRAPGRLSPQLAASPPLSAIPGRLPPSPTWAAEPVAIARSESWRRVGEAATAVMPAGVGATRPACAATEHPNPPAASNSRRLPNVRQPRIGSYGGRSTRARLRRPNSSGVRVTVARSPRPLRAEGAGLARGGCGFLSRRPGSPRKGAGIPAAVAAAPRSARRRARASPDDHPRQTRASRRSTRCARGAVAEPRQGRSPLRRHRCGHPRCDARWAPRSIPALDAARAPHQGEQRRHGRGSRSATGRGGVARTTTRRRSDDRTARANALAPRRVGGGREALSILPCGVARDARRQPRPAGVASAFEPDRRPFRTTWNPKAKAAAAKAVAQLQGVLGPGMQLAACKGSGPCGDCACRRCACAGSQRAARPIRSSTASCPRSRQRARRRRAGTTCRQALTAERAGNGAPRRRHRRRRMAADQPGRLHLTSIKGRDEGVRHRRPRRAADAAKARRRSRRPRRRACGAKLQAGEGVVRRQGVGCCEARGDQDTAGRRSSALAADGRAPLGWSSVTNMERTFYEGAHRSHGATARLVNQPSAGGGAGSPTRGAISPARGDTSPRPSRPRLRAS